MKIVPALLNQSVDEFLEQLEKLRPYYSYFQIDIADGALVANTTIQVSDIAKITKKIKRPTELSFDFHLMVNEYLDYITQIKKLSQELPVKNILIHHKAVRNSDNLNAAIKTAGNKLTIGLVINPEETITTIIRDYDILNLPVIQLMTVYPGFQGSSFLPEMLEKIDQLRNANYRNDIFLDGGISDKTISLINARRYRPDYVGVGSFLTKASNVKQAVEMLNAVVGE